MTESVEEFLAQGGEIKKVDESQRTVEPFNPLKHCDCGCNGDFTEHSMRAGEKGYYYTG